MAKPTSVAPHVGAWIGIENSCQNPIYAVSHPTWVRGLKFAGDIDIGILIGRTPRGCVD